MLSFSGESALGSGKKFEITVKAHLLNGNTIYSNQWVRFRIKITNNGPDTIKELDRISYGLSLNGENLKPGGYTYKVGNMASYKPGDTITLNDSIKINKGQSLNSTQFCIKAFAFSIEPNQIPESPTEALDNESCIEVNYVYQGTKYRFFDIKTVIPDSLEGDTIFSPGNQLVTTYLINQGPDSLYPGDRMRLEYYSKGELNGIFFPYVQFGVGVNDTFFHQINLTHDWKVSNLNSTHCVIGKVVTLVIDSLAEEDFIQDNDNSSCVTQHYVSKPNSLPIVLKGNSLAVYPNPATSEVSIENFSSNEKILIYDLFGKLIKAIDTNSSNVQVLNISEWPAGVYIIYNGIQIAKLVKR